jgi:ketosteroid isomerase-like protein
MARAVLVVPFLVATSTALAAPAALATSPVTRDQLPAGATVRGATLERAFTYRDKRGTHYVVMSSTDTPGKGDRVGPSRAIFVDDWLVAGTAKPRSLLPIRDFTNDCQMGGVNARFHDAATTVTDLDHDGTAELTIAYELSCRSDVSPATYKLLLTTNGAKYILRGETRIDSDGNGLIAGGSFTPDPAAPRWPAPFLAHAKSLWSATADDQESPPHH